MIEELINHEEFFERYNSFWRRIRTIPNEDDRDFLIKYLRQTENSYKESRKIAIMYLDKTDIGVEDVFEKMDIAIKQMRTKYGKKN